VSKPYFPETFFVFPKLDYKLLGTSISVDKEQPYPAVHARNQPNWEAEKKIFIGPNPGMLLEEGTYTRAQGVKGEYLAATYLTDAEWEEVCASKCVGELTELAHKEGYHNGIICGFINEHQAQQWYDKMSHEEAYLEDINNKLWVKIDQLWDTVYHAFNQ